MEYTRAQFTEWLLTKKRKEYLWQRFAMKVQTQRSNLSLCQRQRPRLYKKIKKYEEIYFDYYQHGSKTDRSCINLKAKRTLRFILVSKIFKKAKLCKKILHCFCENQNSITLLTSFHSEHDRLKFS